METTHRDITATGKEGNALLEQWLTPHATPPFGAIATEDYAPAMEAMLAEAERNVAAIAEQAAAPTFENTLVALEEATEGLDRVSGLLLNLNECHTDEAMQATVLEMAPKLARFSSRVLMDKGLFARVETLYLQRDTLGLTAEELTLTEKYYRNFVRGGVGLEAEKQEQFARNAEELSRLTEQFNQNALSDTNAWVLHIADEQELSGLPGNVVAAAAEEACARGQEGWVFTLSYPSYGPFMTYADRRDLREQMWRAYNSRGNRGNGADNNAIIARIVARLLEQARLLGYDTYADYRLATTMAQERTTVEHFLQRLATATLPEAEKELAAVEQFAREECGFEGTMERWDFGYYSEKLKQQAYCIDDELLRPYFELGQVRDSIFSLYGTLYGLTFSKNADIEVYHPDVQAYEVRDGERLMGVLYLDMFPRPDKRSGAWMTDFRGQSCIGGHDVRPLIQVVCNFTKPTTEVPALLSFSEVETFMHEMGHAMHGMLSDVCYPSVSGTNVRHDFVEMPSQVMENWCYERAFLDRIARHYATGEPMPEAYVERIRRARNYLAGWLCLRQVNLGTVDMAYHTLTGALAESAEAFERSHTRDLLPAVAGCCTSTAFTHIFAGGYAAGYYGYKWAEVLDADIFSRFAERGIYDSETAQSFRREILSKGGSEHPAELFRRFMGRDPDPDSLLRRMGILSR